MGPSGSSGATGSQGPVGPSGPTGETGTQGPVGPAGADGREVEFQIDNNVLQWRYEGEETWRSLELEFGGGTPGSIVNTSGSSAFTHWIFAEEPLTIPFPTFTLNSSTTNFTPISNLEEFRAIKNNLAGNYFLTTDIDFAALSQSDLATDGYRVVPGIFTGTLDGKGFDLLNLAIGLEGDYANGVNNVGVFQTLKGATIKNLSLNNFSYKLIGTENNAIVTGGALAGTIVSSNKFTTLDSIDVNNFNVQSSTTTPGDIRELGGLAGRIDFDYSAIVRVHETSINNMLVTLGQGTWSSSGDIGGLFGSAYLGNLSISQTSTDIEFINSQRTSDIGGAIGVVDNINLQIDDSSFSLKGGFSQDVGGIIGEVQEDSKISITNSSTVLDIESYTTNGYNFGGVFGYLDSETITLMNHVDTSGTIHGEDSIGGFIGETDYNLLIRIENSTNYIDLFGEDSIGGFIGETHDDDRLKVLISESENFGNISNNLLESTSSLSEAGGFIGYLGESDTSNKLNQNQVWIRDSIANFNFNIDINIDEFTVTDQNDQPVIIQDYAELSHELNALGGVIGEVYDDNIVRLSNNDIQSTLNVSVEESSFIDSNLNIYQVGGLIGTVDDDSELMLLNNTAQLNLTVNISNYTSTNFVYNHLGLYIELDEIGGSIGEFDGASLLDVAGIYEFNLILDLEDNDFLNAFFTLDLYQIGGYIGYVHSESTIITDSLDLIFTFNVSVVLLENAQFYQIYIDVYNIGKVIGEMDGFGFFDSIDYIAVIDFVIPETGTDIIIDTVDLDNIQFTGNNNNFLVISLA